MIERSPSRSRRIEGRKRSHVSQNHCRQFIRSYARSPDRESERIGQRRRIRERL